MASAVEPLLRQPATRRELHLSPALLLGLVRLGDAALVALAGYAAWRWQAPPAGDGAILPFVLGLATLLFMGATERAGLYELQRLKALRTQLAGLAGCTLLALAGLAALDAAARFAALPRGLLAAWTVAALPPLLLVRLALPALLRRLERGGRLATRVVVVGAGEQGQRLIRRLRGAHPAFRLIGLFDDRRTRVPHYIGGYPVLGGIDELIALLDRHPVDLVIVALPWDAEARILDCMRRLRQLPVDVRLCPDLIGFHLSHRGVSELAGVPLLGLFARPLPGWARAVKAVEDRGLAALVLLLTGPLLLLLAGAIKLSSQGPVFYRQKRYGLHGRVIEVLKFRTMHASACDDGAGPFRQARRDDPRVTPLGRFLRRTSLDELPQFLNVLRGEMSIVGPRPHAVAHSEQMAPLMDAYAARHRVKPGITGWAQVNGLRGETDTLDKMERRLEHDLYYIENWSLSLDLRIICRTLLVGFSHPNAY